MHCKASTRTGIKALLTLTSYLIVYNLILNFSRENTWKMDLYKLILIFVPTTILITITIFAFIFSISNNIKLKKLINKYNLFMTGVTGESIENTLENCIQNINIFKTKNKEFENKLNNIERNVLQCVQIVGIVRYSAFENVFVDTGSDLSFAIALLDSYDTGVLLNGIYSREDSAVYAKAITNGSSKHTLSAEEIQALEIAKKSYRERPYTDSK
jgi:hypothetical protein